MNLGRWCISVSLEPPIGFWGLKERNRMLRAPLGISGAKRWSLWREPGGSSFSLPLEKAPCHTGEVKATHSLSSIYASGSKKKKTNKPKHKHFAELVQEAIGQANASGPKHPIICISLHWANLTQPVGEITERILYSEFQRSLWRSERARLISQ